jgi:hypothetical protein
MGIGRMDIACGLYGKHSDNTDEVTAKTFEYFEDSGKVKKINKYSYCLFKDNDPNTLPSVSGFIASEEFTYYSDTGNRRSMSISEPDEHCVKYRFYFNEEHNGNPGREQAEHKDYGSWTEAVLYEYWEGPEDDDRFQRHWVHHYQSINYSDPDVPVLSGYQISDEYDIDGNYIRSVEICPGDPFIPEGIVAGDESLSLSAQYRELDSKYDALKSKIEQQRDIENAGAAACGEMTGEEGDNLKGALMF